MARMIPPEFQNINNSEAERHLYYELKQKLDETWTIFHSYSFESRTCANKIIDAEIDFLLLHNKYGILVLEVKGGQVICSDGIWYQNSREIKSPFEQARSNKHKIKELIKKSLHAHLPLPIGHAVCFPDSFDNNITITQGHQDITITGYTLNYLSETITDIMKSHTEPEPDVDPRLFKAIKTSLIPIFEFGTSLIDKFGQEDRKVFSLTEQQCVLLSYLSEQKRVLVKGCAGSGKTVIAVKKAKQLALEGHSVLLLCFNKLLAEKLMFEVRDYPNIIAAPYHDYCQSQLRKAGINLLSSGDDKRFYREVIPQNFFNLIEKNPVKYDAVIVDEGQDFLDDYWITINELVAHDGIFYVFYDPDQNIFNSPNKIPIEGVEIVLNKNCRNTIKIFNELKDLASFEIDNLLESPVGEDVQKILLESPGHLRNKLSQILHNLVTEHGIKEKQITIIGTHQLSNTSIGKENIVGKFTLRENGPPATNVIPYYTCMKFKGLESDVVILLDFQDKRWNKHDIKYTAYSRAKHLLFILKLL